jgi:hypothetical protein
MINNQIPYYINEHQSDIRAIKDGWYAMDHEGHLSSGPFSSHDECLKKMSRSVAASDSVARRQRAM